MNRARHSFTWSCICLVLLYAILAAALYVIAGDQFYWKPSGQEIALTESTDGAEPLYGHHELTQSFHLEGDRINAVGFKACTYGRENRGQLCAELLDEAGTPVLSQVFDMGQLPDNDFVFLTLDQPLPIASGGQYTLRLYGLDTAPGTAASAVYNRQAALPDAMMAKNCLAHSALPSASPMPSGWAPTMSRAYPRWGFCWQAFLPGCAGRCRQGNTA